VAYLQADRRPGQRLIIRAFYNKLSTSIRDARTGYAANITNSRDTKHFQKHIRTQLSGPGELHRSEIVGTVVSI
jgi:hypothetical protein